MKQHFSSRLFLTAIIALFACVSIYAETTATAATVHLNPFAYRIGNYKATNMVEKSGNPLYNDNFVINYALSGDATSVIVRFWNASSTWTRANGNNGATLLAEMDITNEKDSEGKECNAKGYHTYTLDFTHIVGLATNQKIENFKTTSLRWTIDVQGGNQKDDLVEETCNVENTTTTSTTTDRTITTTTTPTTYKFIKANQVSDIKKFRRVGGVDICNDPYSYNFGVIFCTEAKRTDLGDDPSYVSYTTVPGVYVFGGGMERLYANYKGDNIPCYGADWNAKSVDFSSLYYAMAPHRVRLSDDGKVFVSAILKGTKRIISQITKPADQDDNNFYEPNETGGGYNHDIFTGGSYNSTTCLWTTTGGKFMLAPNVAMDVQGKWGKNLKLLLISTLHSNSNQYPGYAKEDSYISQYNFGSTTTWSNEAAEILLPGNTLTDANKVKATDGTKIGDLMLLGYQNTNIEYDPQGGFWFVQNRTNDPLAATMLHYNYESGVIDREEHAARRTSGGVRHNHNFTKLAVPGGYPKDSAFFQYLTGGKRYNYNAKTVETGYITIYNVSYNTNGSYTFTDSAYIKNGYGDDVCDFAWDFADNLYVANKKALVALALPHKDKTVSTPARDVFNFTVAPVYPFSAKVNPSGTGVNYASIQQTNRTTKMDNGAPYPQYLHNATIELTANEIPEGCKFYQWENAKNNTATITNNTITLTALSGEADITAHIGLCVYEEGVKHNIQNATTFPAAFVKRELDNTSFSTICLPFNINDIRNLPVGDPFKDAEILNFTGTSQTGSGKDQVTTLNFEQVYTIEAGKPYLIKTSLTGEYTCTGVDNKGLVCPVISGKNSYGGKSVIHNGITFHGVMNPSTIKNENYENNLFLVADNRLANIVNKDEDKDKVVNILGLRAFFTVNPNIVPGKIQLRLPEKTVTSVPTFSIDTLKPTKYLWNGRIYIQRGNNVYDLSGNCVK